MFRMIRFKFFKVSVCDQLWSCGLGDSVGCLLLRLKHLKCSNNHQNVKEIMRTRFYCKAAVVSMNEFNNHIDESEDLPEMSPPSHKFLSKLDEKSQNLCEVFRKEMQIMRRHLHFMPSQITDEQWSDILGFPTRSQRLKFYKYLNLTEYRRQRKKNDQAKRQIQLTEYRKLRKEKAMPFDGLEYGMSKNCIFPRFTAQDVNKINNARLCQASMFGEQLIIDMSYTDYMVKMEYANCAKQISKLIGNNRRSRQPFDLNFCNLSQDTGFHKALLKCVSNLYAPACMVSVTERSYLDIFPKEKLIYLTPHCENDMIEYDFDSIYIIGAFVDKRCTGQISLSKATQEGLRMARLPLDHFLNWGIGRKTLTLYAMLNILLEVKNSGDWNKAFLHIPSRSLIKPIMQVENMNNDYES